MIKDEELEEAIAEERARLENKVVKDKKANLPIIPVITAATSILASQTTKEEYGSAGQLKLTSWESS